MEVALLKPYTSIRIPISGDIYLTEIESNLINTTDFQRLRHLNLLGDASITFPFVHNAYSILFTIENDR